jgi:pimeloyl-ACP methyl ester carboxylesterase
MQDGFVTVDGVRLHYVDYGGNGSPLILEHGTGLVARIWDELAPIFCSRYHTISLERRGHGDSDKPARGYGFADNGREFSGFCGALGLERVDAVGHSAGGTLLPYVSTVRPGLLRRGILLDPIVFDTRPRGEGEVEVDGGVPAVAERIAKRRYQWPGRDEMFDLLSRRAPYDTWTAGSLRGYVEFGTSLLPDGTVELKCLPWIEAKMYGHSAGPSMFEAFARSDSSLRIVRSELTDRVPQANIDEVCRIACDCRAMTLPGVTHFAPMEQPEVVARLCLELLAE